MARGRMINITIAEDETFNAMSIDAQFVFMRTLPHLDRDGLITGNTTLLHSKVTPLLPEYGPKMADIIQEWIANEFVMKYQDGKKDVLFFLNFRKNQYGMRYDKEGPSTFAPPPNYKRIAAGLVPSDSTPESGGNTNNDSSHENVSTDEGRSNSVPIPLLNRREVEEKGNTHASATTEPEAETLPPPTESVAELAAEPEHQPVTEPEQPFPSVTRITYAQVLDARAKVAKEALPAELFDPPSKSQASAPTEPTPGAAHVISFESGEKIFIQDPVWTGLVGAMLDGLGTRALADTGSVNGKAKRREAIFCLETLCKMSDKFRTVDGIKALFESWKKARPNDGAPLPDYLEEHASKYLSGSVRYPNQQKKTPVAPVIVAEPAEPKKFVPPYLRERKGFYTQ